MAGASSSETMLTVNTPDCSALVAESLGRSLWLPAEKSTTGGSLETALKNENGARL